MTIAAAAVLDVVTGTISELAVGMNGALDAATFIVEMVYVPARIAQNVSNRLLPVGACDSHAVAGASDATKATMCHDGAAR